jgi:hypothetical protein
VSRYLVLDVGCAECRSPHQETLVNAIGTEATEESAKARAAATTRGDHVDFGAWLEHGDGWYMPLGCGELRIIDLGSGW